MTIIPPRSTNREPASSSAWAGKLKAYIIPVIMTGVLIQLLFLANMSYMFGSMFKSNSRLHNLKILAVDYDNGDIGRSISGAYSALESKHFPTVQFAKSSDYPTPESLRDAVCNHGYWGAVYTHSGASDRLLSTIEGDNTTAYNPNDAVTYIYNSAYYPSAFMSLKGSIQSLVAAASKFYPLSNPDVLKGANLTSPASVSALLNPFTASEWDIMPTNQGARMLLNTVSMVMPIIMQFFFQMGLNGITGGANMLAGQSKRDVYVFRLCTGKIFTFVSALGMAGYIWAFREDWGVTAGQFVETWMCIWFYMDINYLTIDTIVGTLIPMQFFAFFLLTWIITNIASVVYPFELTPGFYHWSWALPSHNTYLLLVGIWSGCRANIGTTLPILFSWWLVTHVTSAWSVRKRCLLAEAEAHQNEQAQHDKFVRFSTEQSEQFVLNQISSRAANDRSSPERDLEANRLAVGESLPNGSESRTIISTPADRDEGKAGRE
ncbi:hypothetical protein FALCPG4_016561 [Fusarium falciforme]